MMKTLLTVIALSSLLTSQSPPSAEAEFQWGVGVSVGVGAQNPKPIKKVAEKQDPKKKVAKKQDPKKDPKKGDKKGDKKDPTKKDAKGGKASDSKGTEKGKEDKNRIDRPEEDQPMPGGTDPADIAAMKSAEDMLRAEKRLLQEIKSGKITGLDKILPFDELTSWPYEDGLKGMPKRVKKLSGKKVLMTGFMLPIDEVQNIKEFLLVESLWSCCYGQPPDIHGIVRVVMPKDKTTDYFFDPLKIIGTMKVEATMMDGYCVDIYQLHVESLEALKFK